MGQGDADKFQHDGQLRPDALEEARTAAGVDLELRYRAWRRKRMHRNEACWVRLRHFGAPGRGMPRWQTLVGNAR